MPPKWSGIFPAVTTQFREDQSLDLDATARHIEALLEAGVEGLIMLGSLGENTLLEPEEKRDVVRLAIEVAARRVPVLSCVAECSTALACRYARDVQALGADGLMVLPAMVYKSDPREAVAHFRAVAAASDLPIMVYNNPVAYGVDITPRMFAELADEEKLVAIKESSDNVRRITDLINETGDRYRVFIGVDDLVLEAVLLGAVGWVAGMQLAFPRETRRLWDLAMAGRWEEARRIYRWFTPLAHLDCGPKLVQQIKLAIQEVGLGKEWVRQPRLPLAGEEREAVLATIRRGIETRPDVP